MIVIQVLTFIMGITLLAAIFSMIGSVNGLIREIERHNKWHLGQQLHHESHREEVQS